MENKTINIKIIRISANKFKVGDKIMTYLELLEWFKNKVLED